MIWKIVCFTLLIPFSLQAQDANELVRRNGFKDIKLGTSVDSVKGATFLKDLIELKEFETKLYEVDNPDVKKVGEVEVKKVELKTYKGLIYEIIVTTEKDPRIMKGLEKSFGKATYNIRSETYSWRAPNIISLNFKGIRNGLKLTYLSHPVIKLMYADKNKKVEEIADDF